MILKEALGLYMQAPEWLRLSARTKTIYSHGIVTLEPLWSFKMKRLDRPTLIGFRDELWNSSGRCHIAFNVLRATIRFCLDRGYMNDNPAYGIPMPRSTPIARWSDEELNKAIETAPDYLRSALLLALYTGQRLSDLTRIQWVQYDGKIIHLKQRKTGKELFIPVHPTLKADLDERRAVAETATRPKPFLIWNHSGDPFTTAGLSGAVHRHLNKIGIKGRSFHGIRKATASILAELGCTPFEIMAITGHSSLREVQRYTLQASQLRLAKEAMRRWSDETRI